MSKLYHQLEALAYGEALYLATRELQLQLQQYFLQLEHSSAYLLTSNTEPDFAALLKAMGVQLENTADNFVEQLALYLDIQASLLGKKSGGAGAGQQLSHSRTAAAAAGDGSLSGNCFALDRKSAKGLCNRPQLLYNR